MNKKLKNLIAFVLILVLLMSALPANAAIVDQPFLDYYEPAYWKFKDVPVDRWSFPYIKLLRDSCVINGINETSFEPESFVTRAQFVKMLGGVAGIKTGQFKGSSFKDVPANAWYAPYVQWAVQNGVTKGTYPEMFQPEAHILRQDIATMIHRYVTIVGMELPTDGKVRSFIDENEIASYAKEAVTAMQKAQIINGEKNKDKTYSFHPTDKATREQTAKMLCVLNECRLQKIREDSEKAYAVEVMKNWIIANSNVPYDRGSYTYAETLVYEENNIQTLFVYYNKGNGGIYYNLEVLTGGLTYRYTLSIPLSTKRETFTVGFSIKQSNTVYVSCNHTYTKGDGKWGNYDYTMNNLYNPESNGISDKDVKKAFYQGGQLVITFAEYLFKYQVCRPDASTTNFNVSDVGQFDI